MLQRKEGNDETVAPPTPHPPLGRMLWMARGAELGVMGGVRLNSKSESWLFFFPRKRRREGVKKSGSMPARRSPILVPRTHCHITPLWKNSGVTQSMCCTSHMCSRGLLNAVIRLCAGSKPQHNNKARPSSFIILHVPGNPEKVKRPQSRPEWRRSLLLGVNSAPRVFI